MSSKEILFLGATGYIGGTVLWKLLLHLPPDTFHISALVRDIEKAERLKAFRDEIPGIEDLNALDLLKKAFRNVTLVIGTLDDLDLLQELARKADVVISMACSSFILHK